MTASNAHRPSPDATVPPPIPLVPDLTPEALDRALSAPHQPLLLLDLWAPWCQPCLAQAPALERLAAVTAGRLRVVKLNTQDHPDVAKGLQVRGIPLLILFRDGHEVARLVGQQSFERLCEWVDEHAETPVVDSSAPAFRTPPPLGGAFYGDPQLRSFLLDRTMAAAAQGRIDNHRFPHWSVDRGSVASTMVRHESPDVFARITGLPAVFGFCLHFVGVRTPEALQEVFDGVPAGADVRGAAARLMLRWLGDDQIDWRAHVGAEADTLRIEWLKLCREWLHGEPPLPETWAALAARARALDDDDPLHVVQEHLGIMLARLCPPPAEEEPVWGSLLLLTGTYLVVTLVQRDMGWADEHFALEVRRDRWFRARCADPRAVTEEALDALREQYLAEHRKEESAHEARMAAYAADRPRVEAFDAKLRGHLVAALREAQQG